MAQISVSNLTKKFGKHVVLENVSVDIPQHKIFGMIGESGSGKTTFLKTIIGFWKYDGGEILFEGRPLEKNLKFVRQILGYATQEVGVYPRLTVKENLEYFGALANVPRDTLKRNIDKVIGLVELKGAENTLAENLSGGMERRLDLACALINNPKVLILDEPTEDLDPLLRIEIVELIKRINQQETTVIITSHLLHEAEQLCDVIAILHKGKILAVGSPDEIKDRYTKDEEIHLITEPKKYEELLKGLGRLKGKISKSAIRNNKLVLYTKYAEEVLLHLLREIEKRRERLVEVSVKRPSLSEVFAYLIKKSGD